jgi:predicted GIY-YIG superfamily endonuclease
MADYSDYILANKRNGTLYVGFTSDLVQRVYAHKNKLIERDNPGWRDLYEDII